MVLNPKLPLASCYSVNKLNYWRKQCRIKGVVGLGLNFYLGLFLYPILVPTCAYYRETI